MNPHAHPSESRHSRKQEPIVVTVTITDESKVRGRDAGVLVTRYQFRYDPTDGEVTQEDVQRLMKKAKGRNFARTSHIR